jgi:hypothetical protein
MTEACAAYKKKCCVYVIADGSGVPLYVGASESKGGLDGRYHGGTAAAVDAAMHCSGNFVHVAESDLGRCFDIEKALIYAECRAASQGAKPPLFNRHGRIIPLSSFQVESLVHEGDSPAFRHRAVPRLP